MYISEASVLWWCLLKTSLSTAPLKHKVNKWKWKRILRNEFDCALRRDIHIFWSLSRGRVNTTVLQLSLINCCKCFEWKHGLVWVCENCPNRYFTHRSTDLSKLYRSIINSNWLLSKNLILSAVQYRPWEREVVAKVTKNGDQYNQLTTNNIGFNPSNKIISPSDSCLPCSLTKYATYIFLILSPTSCQDHL